MIKYFFILLKRFITIIINKTGALQYKNQNLVDIKNPNSDKNEITTKIDTSNINTTAILFFTSMLVYLIIFFILKSQTHDKSLPLC